MQGIAAFPDTIVPRFVDVPEPPSAGACHVLCRTLELGVCGTDREILHSARPMTPAGDGFLVLGHECLARVESLGEGAEALMPATSSDGALRPLAVGDLVVPTVRRPGPNRRPRRLDMQPMGNYTERGIVEQHGFSTPWWTEQPEFLLRVPAELRALAVLAEPLSVAEKGVNEAILVQTARLEPGVWQSPCEAKGGINGPPPRVLVTGLGPIGFAGAIASLARGWPTTVYGRDKPDTFRAQLVEQLGAKYLSADATDLDPKDVEADGYELILECTGSDDVMVASAASLVSCGVLVWLGSTRRPKRMMRDGVLRNHIHLGTVNSAARDFRDALVHLAQFQKTRPAALAALVTARVPPRDALWHYENREPQGIKTVVMYA
jgi:glucose 1-dehydrogenase